MHCTCAPVSSNRLRFSLVFSIFIVLLSFPVFSAADVSYITDGGFEQGTSGFTGNGTQVSLNTTNPLVGSSSLGLQFSNWSSIQFLNAFGWNTSPLSSALTGQVTFRVDQTAANAEMELCVKANYEDGTLDVNCSLVQLLPQIIYTMTSVLSLDSTKHIQQIRLVMQLHDTGTADISVDPASLVLGDGGSGGNTPPVASFAFNASNTNTLDIDFDASGSSDSDGVIASYAWDFGDGATGSGQQVAHSYSAAGDYSVALTVTDNDGGVDTVTTNVSVLEVLSAAQYAMLTPQKIQKIRSNITTDPATWNKFVSTIDQEVSSDHGYVPNDSGNNWRYLLAPLALRIVADPSLVSQQVIYFYKDNYLSALDHSDFVSGSGDARNQSRQHMGDFARSYIWTSSHIPEFWSQAEINEHIAPRFKIWVDHWAQELSDLPPVGDFYPSGTQDSDEVISMVEAMQLYAETGLLDTQSQLLVEGGER